MQFSSTYFGTTGRGGMRALFRAVCVASILALASACDKQPAGEADVPMTSLANKPKTLLLLFGEATDPRVLPIATLTDGRIKPIALDAQGWRNFDSLYFTAGSRFPVYHSGKSSGDAVIRRGMWQGGDALYKLPGCTSPRPLGAVTLDPGHPATPVLESLATSDALAPAPPRAELTAADADSAKALSTRIGQREGLTNAARGELDEVVNALATGATQRPTLLGTWMERGSGLNGVPRHVFLLGDYDDASKSYVQSYVHVPRDTVREFQRYIDHADLTGDGTDEIVIESWRNGGDSYLVFLQFNGGRWRPVARGATSWCADPAKS